MSRRSLAAACFAWRRALARDALRRLGRDFLSFAAFFLAAHAFSGRSQTTADALGFRLLRFAFAVAFGRTRIVFAADQFDLRNFGAVALAETDAQQPGVSACTLGEPWCKRVEQLC